MTGPSFPNRPFVASASVRLHHSSSFVLLRSILKEKGRKEGRKEGRDIKLGLQYTKAPLAAVLSPHRRLCRGCLFFFFKCCQIRVLIFNVSEETTCKLETHSFVSKKSVCFLSIGRILKKLGVIRFLKGAFAIRFNRFQVCGVLKAYS